MADKRLLGYIRRMLSQGYSEREIRNALLNYGYPENEIEEALSGVIDSGRWRGWKYIFPLAGILAVVLILVFYLPHLFIPEKEGSRDYSEIKLSQEDKQRLNEALSVCEMMNNANNSERCRMMVNTAIKKNPSHCNNYKGELKDYCYAYTASARGEESICNKVGDKKIRNKCIAYVAFHKKDSSLCDKLEEEVETSGGLFDKKTLRLRDGCVTVIARIREDVSLCDRLKEKVVVPFYSINQTIYPRDICRSQFAVLENDISYCYEIDESLRDTCLTSFANATEDPSICEKIELEEDTNFRGDKILDADSRNRCLMTLAKSTLNAELCKRVVSWDNQKDKLISRTWDRSECLEPVLEETGEAEFCKDLGDFSDFCYQIAAKGSGDVSVCENIENKSSASYESCIGNAAEASGDTSICNFFKNKSSFDYKYCFITAKTKKAILRKDPSICEGFEDDFEKEELIERGKSLCYGRYGLENEDYSVCEKGINRIGNRTAVAANECYLMWAEEEEDPSLCDIWKGEKSEEIKNRELLLDACYELVVNKIAHTKEEIFKGMDEYLENLPSSL